MGASIAAYFLHGGWAVHAFSQSEVTRRNLIQRTETHLECSENAAAMRVYDSLGDIPWDHINLVVESVTEDLATKRKLFAEVERLAHKEAIFVSNTSGILVSEIYAGMESVSRMAGLHHFMPAHLVPLVEIVGAPGTSAKTIMVLKQWMEGLGKVPIVCSVELPGLIANRIQHALMREALHLISDGVASPDDVDKAVRFGFGFRYVAAGPILQKELSGWDVNCDAATSIYPSLCNDKTPNPKVMDMVKKGRLGTKTKRGFWKWDSEQFEILIGQYTKALSGALNILNSDKQV